MAEQNKKADGTQFTDGGVTGVSPLNMGKGLLWDPVTKTYYVAIDERMFEVDELGRLKLRVSALEDNQLKVRNDGIYQGNTAKPELRNLHVDAVNGVDQDPLKVEGAGTRAKPLRTIRYALNLGELFTTRNILLKEQQEHAIDASGGHIVPREGTVNISSYGDEIDRRWREHPSFGNSFLRHQWIVQEDLAAKLVFKGVLENNYLPAQFNNPSAAPMIMGDLTCLTISDKVILNIQGIVIVQDLGFNFTAVQPETIRDVMFVNPARIYNVGIVRFTNCGLSTRGTPIIRNPTERMRQKPELNMLSPHNGRYEAGFIHSVDGEVYLRNINFSNYPLTDLKAYLFGSLGWHTNFTAQSSVSFNASGNVAEVAKLFRHVTRSNGEMVAPTVDVSTSLFS